MNKNDILSLANKGKQKYEDFEFEVTTHTDNDGAEMLNVTLFPVNEYSDYAYFGGGWVKYYKDEDFEQLIPAMKEAVKKMKLQADIATSWQILRLTDLHKEDRHCNHLFKGIDNKKTFTIQHLKDKDGKVFGFQVLTTSNWWGGYKPDCPINIKIDIDGVKYIPVWSFWLNGAVYKLGGEKNNDDKIDR